PAASAERGAALGSKTLRIGSLAAWVWRSTGWIAAGGENLRLRRSIQVQNGWSGIGNSGCENQPLQSLTAGRRQLSVHRCLFLVRSLQRQPRLQYPGRRPD